MADTLRPRDAKEVEAVVQSALAGGKTMEIVGHGSKRAIGRPAQTDLTVDLSALTGVTLYEPEELVLSAKAGTPLAEIEALLAANAQQLAFEPMDYAAVLGGVGGRGTIGGALAANVSGPRRIKVGAARDHFLGVCAVSGRGESFKSGGRVVKNVTGYDLCKLMAGSWGTLAAMTDVTIKVLPRSETEQTLLIRGLEPGRAVAAMTSAMGSSCDVSGAAHLPADIAARIPVHEIGGGDVTALRLEGFSPSVVERKRMLTDLMEPFGELATADEQASRALWTAIRDATPFAADGSSQSPRQAAPPLWRISTAPSRGAELAAMIATVGQAQMFFDWAGGLIWAMLRPCDDEGEALVRRAVAATGGHATLIRAPVSARAAIDVFAPQNVAVAALTKRVKESFDPKGVLNPGRMWAGV
jgi:glycolate oxidase FAD binding subunit